MSPARRRRVEPGSATVEMVILTPVVLLLIALVVAGGRVALASNALAGVAGSAAREASLARSPQQALAAARANALRTLADQRLHCLSTQIIVDTAGFAAPPGAGGTVRVDVYCTVALNEMAMPGIPGSRTLHDYSVSPIDPFRETTP
jgi:Flp pilus assembly protein TadG